MVWVFVKLSKWRFIVPGINDIHICCAKRMLQKLVYILWILYYVTCAVFQHTCMLLTYQKSAYILNFGPSKINVLSRNAKESFVVLKILRYFPVYIFFQPEKKVKITT